MVREATGGKYDLDLSFMSQVVALMEMNDKMKAKLRSADLFANKFVTRVISF